MDLSEQFLDVDTLFLLIILHLGRQWRLVDALLDLEVVGVVHVLMGLQPQLDIAPPRALRYLIQQKVGLYVIVIGEVVSLSDELLHIVVQRLVGSQCVFLGEEMEEEFAESAVVEQSEAGALEVEDVELAVQPLVHELAGLVVAVDVEELVVDEEGDDVVHVALVHYLVDSPDSKVDLSNPTLIGYLVVCPPRQEFVETSLEDSGHWWAIHLLLEGLDGLVGSWLVEHMLFGRELDHIGNAYLIAFGLQPELPCWIPHILMPKLLKQQLRRPSLLDGRLDEIQPYLETRSSSVGLPILEYLRNLSGLEDWYFIFFVLGHHVFLLDFGLEVLPADRNDIVFLLDVLQLAGVRREAVEFVLRHVFKEISYGLGLFIH